jgi:hypothetical protein
MIHDLEKSPSGKLFTESGQAVTVAQLYQQRRLGFSGYGRVRGKFLRNGVKGSVFNSTVEQEVVME